MEEAAAKQEKKEGSGEGGHDGGKAGWMNECSLSSILKHSCLLCWSSPRETGVVETDERVLAKTTEIRELEHAVAVENLELQEQQSDRRELEETLGRLETHKEELVQQLKTTRQLCCEESQQILSLQAEETQKESQVEEYERELARARWRLKKLREEVKQAKRKVEEAGERDIPLQDSIRQSYEEILQEQQTLYSLSGGAVTPDSQLEESTSPADTIEEETLPMRPWGRSQSLPAYADLIMNASGSSFCNNLTETREEEDSSSSTPKIDRSDVDEEEEEEGEGKKENEGEREKREKEELNGNPNQTMSQLDFYQADPFVHCQTDHELFNEDLFPKTDSSDVFAADPFKGTDPFAADILFSEASVGADGGAVNVGDEVDTSLSCAENKASTGTQCFESEFPGEDSDIEISYSREDLDAIATDTATTEETRGFKPIQSSSEEGLEGGRVWRSQAQYSVESDPNGYELDLGAISPPSDVEELSMGSLSGEGTTEAAAGTHQGLGSGFPDTFSELQTNPGGVGSEPILSEPDWTNLGATEHPLPCKVMSCQGEEWDSTIEGEPQNTVTPQNSLDSPNPLIRTDSEQNRELSFELSYEAASQSSFDPYGFKLSPEHSSHSFLDPDESELSPEPNGPDLTFDPEPSSSQPDQLNFNPYGFDITSSQMVSQDVFDPYGFKLSPEEENQEVLDICDHAIQEVMELCSYDNQERVEPCYYSNQEVLEPCTHDNQEMLEPCSHNNQERIDVSCHKNQEVMDLGSHDHQELLDFCSNGNREVLEPFHDNEEVLDLFSNENQEVVELYSHDNQEALEPCHCSELELLESHNHNNQQLLEPFNYDNQEVLEPRSHQEVLDLACHKNQEVLDLGTDDNQKLLDFCSNENQEVLEPCHDNEEVLDLFSNDNKEVLDLLSTEVIPEANNNNNHCVLEPELNVNPTNNTSKSSAGDLASEVSSCPTTVDLLGLDLSNTSICTSNTTNNTNTNTADPLNMVASQDLATLNISANQDLATFNVPTSHNLLEDDLGSVFGAGGYVACPDVADDLEPLDRRQESPVAEPVRPVRPVRPPRPSLRAKQKAQSQTQGIDLK